MRELDPQTIKARFIEFLAEGIGCTVEDGAFKLDTPYILPDGRFIQLYIQLGPDWTLVVSDRGYATQQVTVFSEFEDKAKARYEKIRELARQLDPDYVEGELRFMAENLDEALRRIPVLARAIVIALGMVTAG